MLKIITNNFLYIVKINTNKLKKVKIMKTNETLVTKYNVYLPSVFEVNRTVSTVGERRFFQNKFWKLAVMLGFDWNNSVLVQRGFSTLNVKSKFTDSIIDFLNANRVEFKISVSQSGYTLQINVSTKKKNLEKIDRMYWAYFSEQLSKANTYGLSYESNYLVSDEMITFDEWTKENKRIQKL